MANEEKVTNYDLIHAMNDERLAEWLTRVMPVPKTPWLEWLRSEAEIVYVK
jgi:hypothetical protein